MSVLISVIIPVYNTGKYLDRCVSSVLKQDYKNIETIIVDDGSTDPETIAKCDFWGRQCCSILVFHKENGGSASARNYGILKAKGEYIGFVDSDDVIEPDMFSSLLNDAKKHHVKIALGGIATERSGRMISKLEDLPSGEVSNTDLLHHFFLGQWHSACTNLYEKTLFETSLFPEKEVNEDYFLNYRLFKTQSKVYYNNKVFYHYIRRSGSNTSSPISLSFFDWLKHTELVLEEYGDSASLSLEAWYQYLYSNIVLGNKSILTLSRQPSEDADIIYDVVTNNLCQNRNKVLCNKYLSLRYKLFGLLMSILPKLYKSILVLSLRIKRGI